ncbi:hypothetical protein HMPREF9123_1747 [Neisseria bacilliformis ATCC BAA-1200]|uniref:Uncharacterized protein n=1 Tax=Neisseria bacilliformis ATCC BAA-1200 TaxID=888742 RepID=F2BDE1_9NEIS|nr:hypothetical protein HMPREF9123_1747 [Neisseria bacilliformis ATCC BAA-1200]
MRICFSFIDISILKGGRPSETAGFAFSDGLLHQEPSEMLTA